MRWLIQEMEAQAASKHPDVTSGTSGTHLLRWAPRGQPDAVSWLLGYSLKASRTQAAIAQENVLLLVQHQQATTQMAVQEEQERLCRELQAVIAHSVGVIVAQASAGRLVFGEQPEFAREGPELH
jgi:hypothetical protein